MLDLTTRDLDLLVRVVVSLLVGVGLFLILYLTYLRTRYRPQHRARMGDDRVSRIAVNRCAAYLACGVEYQVVDVPGAGPAAGQQGSSARSRLQPYPADVVSAEIEYPQIRYVIPPTRLDGTPTGQAPRMRHDPDCSHFKSNELGGLLGNPVLATDEQMRTLKPCTTCVARRGESTRTSDDRGGKHGEPCPTCGLTLPLTGVCDNCD